MTDTTDVRDTVDVRMGARAETLLDGLPEIGVVIAGKYTIERVLAVGGMGAVMAAHDAALDRPVAIKFMLPKALESPEVRARFFREAKAAVAIRSEHVVDIYEVGVAPPDTPFIVMEYLPGRDLHSLLESRSGVPVVEAVDYVLQACEALAEAHSIGIVHRDIKPSNLFVTYRPDGSAFVKVVDFGISKTNNQLGLDNTNAKNLTQSSVALGSPLYMSPEQVRNSKVVDARTDIWSLGVVLYELLTNRLPFDGETVPSLAAAIASDPPHFPSSVRADIPPRLEAIILKCLEKDPAKRYSRVSNLARDLAEFAPPGYKTLSYDRIEQQGAVSALAFESTSQHQSPLSAHEFRAHFPVAAETVGAATTAGLGTTHRQAERKRRSVVGFGLAAFAVATIGAGAAFLTAGGPLSSITELASPPASIAPATAVSASLASPQAKPIVPDEAAKPIVSAPVVAPVAPRVAPSSVTITSNPAVFKSAPKKPLPAKPVVSPAASTKVSTPSGPAETNQLPSVLGGGR